MVGAQLKGRWLSSRGRAGGALFNTGLPRRTTTMQRGPLNLRHMAPIQSSLEDNVRWRQFEDMQVGARHMAPDRWSTKKGEGCVGGPCHIWKMLAHPMGKP